jgi:tight adherence protein B
VNVGVVALAALACSALWRAALVARVRASMRARTGAARPVAPVPSALAAGAGGSVLAGLWGGPVLAALVAGGFVAVPRVRRRRAARRAARASCDVLPEVVDAIAGALRAGLGSTDALRAGAASAPPGLAGELERVAVATARGMSLADAVDAWAAAGAARDDGGRALVAAACSVHASAGGDPARSLAGVADTLHERRAVRREVGALAAQARLSAGLLAVAPLAFGAIAAGADGRAADFVLRTPAGAVCVALGAGLDLLGWRWMARITGSVR